MAALKTCSKPENDSSENSELDNLLEKKKRILLQDAKSVAGFSTNFDLGRITSHKHGPGVSKWQHPQSNSGLLSTQISSGQQAV